MKYIAAVVLFALLLEGCKSPEPPEYPVETTFIINTVPQGAHIILASPTGYPPKYLGKTPINESWNKIVSSMDEIPRNFYVLALREGNLPREERVAYVNLQPTIITLELEKGAPTVLTRSAFKSYSKGLGIEDLKTIWGPPVSTSATNEGTVLYYTGITYDRLSESIDRNVQVVTKNNRITDVNFY